MARKRKKRQNSPVTLRPRQSWGQKQRLKALLYNLGALLLLVGAAFGVSQLQVSSIVVEGHNDPELVEKLVDEQLNAGFLWNNLAFLPQERLEERLKSAPEILAEDVQLKKNWFRRQLVVKILEREPALLWQSGEEVFTVDSNGWVIKLAEDDSKLPLVIDTSQVPVSVDSQVAPPSFVAFAELVEGEIEEETDLKPLKIMIEETISEAIVETEQGIDLRFATNLDTANQVENIKLTLRHAQDTDTPVTSYIDVRIPYKAYYR